MNLMLVLYAPEELGLNYARLIEAIQSLGPWRHYFEPATLVESELSSEQICDILKPYTNGGRLLVTELGRDAAWDGFGAESSAWLKDNLSRLTP